MSGSADRVSARTAEPPVSLPICRHAPRCRQRKRRATSGSSVGFGTSAGSFRPPGAGARLAESSVVKDWRRNWPAAVVHQGELGMYTRACLVALALTVAGRSEEHTSELQSLAYLVCRLLLEK